MHREYTDHGNIQIRIFDDRLEIWSPGLLPKEMNIKSLLAENRSIPRNRGLAKIFHDIGFIEGWGTGFQRMVEGCAMNGNPKPEFKEMAGAFVVKFIRKPASEGISGGINEGTSEGINRTLDKKTKRGWKDHLQRRPENGRVLYILKRTD